MFKTKLRFASMLVVAIILLAAAKISIPWGAWGAAPVPEPPKVPRELLERRLKAVKKILEIKSQMFLLPRGIGDAPQQNRDLGSLRSDILGWSERLLEAELSLCEKKSERIEVLKKHIDRIRRTEQAASKMVQSSRSSPLAVAITRYEWMNAEIRYFQETGKILEPLPTDVDPKQEELPPPGKESP